MLKRKDRIIASDRKQHYIKREDQNSFIVTAFNDLEVKLGDILNAYVQAPATEKVWATLGPEFGMDICK